MIHVGGIDVGFMISNIPFLHPETWKGTGLPLNMTVNGRARGKVEINPKR